MKKQAPPSESGGIGARQSAMHSAAAPLGARCLAVAAAGATAATHLVPTSVTTIPVSNAMVDTAGFGRYTLVAVYLYLLLDVAGLLLSQTYVTDLCFWLTLVCLCVAPFR